METVPEDEAAAHPTPTDRATARILAEMMTGADEIARVRLLRTEENEAIELRLWRRAAGEWHPGDGFSLPAELLPELRRTLAQAEALIGMEAPPAPPGEPSRATQERIRALARQVALARERLEALRPEDYQRPQDYRRVRTLRLVELHRQETILARAQAGAPDDTVTR
jgi:hypothetical protein